MIDTFLEFDSYRTNLYKLSLDQTLHPIKVVLNCSFTIAVINFSSHYYAKKIYGNKLITKIKAHDKKEPLKISFDTSSIPAI